MIPMMQKVIVVKNIIVFFLFFLNSKTKQKKQKKASCSTNPCLNGGQCSTRLNGNYHCECVPGYTGINCEYGYLFFFFHFFLFLNYVFSNKQNEIVVSCGTILNESNSKWNETIANGEIIYGECLEGFNGTISRSCLQNGSIGNWSSISGSCQGILFILFFFLFFLINKK